MNIFSHFIFLIISLSCSLLDTQVKIANGSLISPVIEHERAETISICAMFGENSRSRSEAKVAIEMVIYDFYLIRNQSLFLHFRNSQGRPGPAAVEANDLISTYGVKAILGAHKRDEASAIAEEAASDEAHDHVPVFQSFANSIPATPTFPWFLQANQLNKQKHRFLVLPATLGSGYGLYQLGNKLNMTEYNYALIATHSFTELFHSIGPKKMSTLQDFIETKTYFPENWQIFHDFGKRFGSDFTIIHPDEPGICASQAYDPVRALFCKPNVTNLFQRISAADPSANLQFINWEKFSAKVVEFVNVTGKTHQIQYRIKEFGFSETIDVGALYLKSIEISEEVLLPEQLLYTERRQRILTNRSEPITVGVPAQLMFRQFVEVKIYVTTCSSSFNGFLPMVFGDSMEVADVNNDVTYNFYPLNWEYDDLVTQVASGKFDAVGDVTILKERHNYEDSSLNYTSLWSLILPITILILAITIYNGFILWLIKINHNPKNTLSADKLHNNLTRMVMAGGLFVALILTQSYNSILSSMLAAQRLAPPTKDVATLKYAHFSQPYTESGMKSVVPIRSRLPIQAWHRHTEKRRRILTSRSKPIRVGVPAHSMFQQFVKVETDPKTNVTSYDGFSLKVFEEAMKIADVNNDLTYKYYSFDGEYDDLVKQIDLGKFDVVAGDVSILEERHKYADFSQAYTELGMVLVVPIRSRLPIQMWLFMNPFTTELWGLILAITIYNGFVVWLIERNENPGFKSGTVWNQIETLFWPASTTLFTLSADKLQSILSRMVMVVWLFVALILTQSYTSILSSMLTAQRLAPATKDVATLKKMNATVGYCRESFLKSYMINALGFDSANIRKYSSPHDYAKALKTGEIAGIFLEVPSAKVFLAEYCKSFMRTEKIFKVGGYGFAFRKNFPLLSDINEAILKISENGKLLELEERYLNSDKCAEQDLFSNEDAGIGLESFAILFVLSGCTSTVALAIYVIRHIICSLNSTPEHNNLFKRVSAFTKTLIKYRRPSSAIVINIENPPDAPYNSEVRQPVSTTIDTERLEDHLEAPDTDNKV